MRALLIGLAIVTSCIAGWLLLGPGESPRNGAISSGQANPPGSIGSRAPAADQASATDSEIVTDDRPSPGRELLETPQPPAFFTVRVEDFEAGQPIADATVLFIEPGTAGLSEAEWMEASRDDVAFARRHYRTVTSNSRGLAQVPHHQSLVHLIAVSEDRYATGRWRPTAEEPVVLRMQRDRELVVHAEDSNGEPLVGAEILLCRARGTEEPQPYDRGQSDEAGSWSFHHLQRYDGESDASLLAVGRVPGIEVRSAPLDPDAPLQEVVLRFPPTGAVRVRTLEADGSPLDPRTLSMRDVIVAHLDRTDQNTIVPRTSAHSPLDDAGVATFPHVALGVEFQAVAKDVAAVRFQGPGRAGEVVAVTLQREPGGTVLSGRLVDVEQRPLADLELQLDRATPTNRREDRLRTDSEGRFRTWLDANFVGPEVELSVGSSRWERDPRRTWQVALGAHRLTPGQHDLGDIVKGAALPIAAGQLWIDDAPSGAGVTLVVERQEQGFWRRVPRAQPAIEEDGRFVVHGVADPGELLRLTVFAGQLLEVPPLEFKSGADDLQLRLRTGGSVRAIFRVDDDVPFGLLEYALVTPDDPAPHFAGRRKAGTHAGFDRAGEGRVALTWSGLPAGTRSLLVHAPGEDEPVVRIDGLRVHQGACDDPRLDDIDLRGLARKITIRVLDFERRPLERNDAFVLIGEQVVRGFSLSRGPVQLAVSRPHDLLVEAPDHRTTSIPAVFADVEIALELAPRIPLRVEPAPGLPEDGPQLVLRLRPTGPESQRMAFLDTGSGGRLANHLELPVPIPADGTTRLRARRTGPHEVHAWLVGDGLEVEVVGIEPATWSIPGSVDDQTAVFTIPAEALQAARARFERR